mmetsp:Transcript_32026/g.74808  ORF Transcript_32026/g.74808 Transcript_32026/m.74808 type:complete len:200 (-) Transcript_32026:485-1084(-)
MSPQVFFQHKFRISSQLIERSSPRTHEVHDQSESIDVNFLIVLLMPDNFRGHVEPAANTTGHGVIGGAIVGCRHDFGDTHVSHFDLQVLVQQQIKGLQVPVNQRLVAMVKKCQRSCHSRAPFQDPPQRWTPDICHLFSALCHVVALEVTPGHVFGDAHNRCILIQACSKKHNHIRMPFFRHHVDFVQQLFDHGMMIFSS